MGKGVEDSANIQGISGDGFIVVQKKEADIGFYIRDITNDMD